MILVRVCRQTSRRLSMHLLAGAAATAIATLVSLGAVSLGANAADLNTPPPLLGQPQYGIAPPPAIAPPQVIMVPVPMVVPQYPSATVPPPPVGAPSYGVAPPIAPRADVAPRGACPLIWRCGERGCGWQPSCVPPPERYSGQYDAPGPIYPPPAWREPQLYSTPDLSPAPEPYPYSPQIYPGPYSQ